MNNSAESLWRKREIEETIELGPLGALELGERISLNPYRNQVIEEVALEIEKFKGFGQTTIDSFCIYIRNMKK